MKEDKTVNAMIEQGRTSNRDCSQAFRYGRGRCQEHWGMEGPLGLHAGRLYVTYVMLRAGPVSTIQRKQLPFMGQLARASDMNGGEEEAEGYAKTFPGFTFRFVQSSATVVPLLGARKGRRSANHCKDGTQYLVSRAYEISHAQNHDGCSRTASLNCSKSCTHAWPLVLHCPVDRQGATCV